MKPRHNNPLWKNPLIIVLLALGAMLLGIYALGGGKGAHAVEILNVSYDPTREFYADYNEAFKKHWKIKTGEDIRINQSHGGSGKQARAVIDGLKADVVTLALAYDIDSISKNAAEKMPRNWQSLLPNNSAPYTSTIVFLVRKGNPVKIHDWDDLTREGVKVVTPNPKTSGGARWIYLAAWAYAQKKFGGNEQKTMEFVSRLLRNVPVLDTGARAATTSFVQRGLGDVLLTWENEAFLAVEELGHNKFEIIVPSLSIRAEPSVAVVQGNTNRKKTTKIAQDYLRYLYSKEGQELAAKHYYRPVDPVVMAAHRGMFPAVNMVTVDENFGGWQAAQEKHFSDGGTFDRIYNP